MRSFPAHFRFRTILYYNIEIIFRFPESIITYIKIYLKLSYEYFRRTKYMLLVFTICGFFRYGRIVFVDLLHENGRHICILWSRFPFRSSFIDMKCIKTKKIYLKISFSIYLSQKCNFN